MPYASDDVPEQAKKYDDKGRRAFVEAFNSAKKQYGDESKAFAIAHAAAKKAGGLVGKSELLDEVNKHLIGRHDQDRHARTKLSNKMMQGRAHRRRDHGKRVSNLDLVDYQALMLGGAVLGGLAGYRGYRHLPGMQNVTDDLRRGLGTRGPKLPRRSDNLPVPQGDNLTSGSVRDGSRILEGLGKLPDELKDILRRTGQARSDIADDLNIRRHNLGQGITGEVPTGQALRNIRPTQIGEGVREGLASAEGRHPIPGAGVRFDQNWINRNQAAATEQGIWAARGMSAGALGGVIGGGHLIGDDPHAAKRKANRERAKERERQRRQEARGMSKSDNYTLSGEFSKFDDEQRIAFGWASVTDLNGQPVVDRQGDVIKIDDLENSAYEYVLSSRVGGEMHKKEIYLDGDGVNKSVATRPKKVAELVESVVFTPEKIAKMGLPPSTPQGWWIGMKVTDDNVWKAVKDGRYSAFSIHGSGKRTERIAKRDDSLSEQDRALIERVAKYYGMGLTEDLKPIRGGIMRHPETPKDAIRFGKSERQRELLSQIGSSIAKGGEIADVIEDVCAQIMKLRNDGSITHDIDIPLDIEKYELAYRIRKNEMKADDFYSKQGGEWMPFEDYLGALSEAVEKNDEEAVQSLLSAL